MFRQPRNAKRASRACKVQQGLEQLEVRVVPSTAGIVGPPSGPPPIYSPPPKQATQVRFDELGNIQGGDLVKWKDLDRDVQKALDVKGGPDQEYVYVLDKSINLDKYGGDVWVKVTEPSSKKDGGYGEQQTSDVLHIVTIKTGYGKWEKDTTYVSVFSDKDQKSGSYGDSGSDGKGGNKGEQSLFDVGIPKVKKFDITTQEKGPEGNNYATFDVNDGMKNEVDFFFQSDGKLSKQY